MECCCYDFDGTDYDAPQLYNRRITTARRQYLCEECSGPIKSGTRYETAKGVIDGTWWAFRTCLGCVNLRDDLACGGAVVHGELATAVMDCLDISLFADASDYKD